MTEKQIITETKWHDLLKDGNIRKIVYILIPIVAATLIGYAIPNYLNRPDMSIRSQVVKPYYNSISLLQETKEHIDRRSYTDPEPCVLDVPFEVSYRRNTDQEDMRSEVVILLQKLQKQITLCTNFKEGIEKELANAQGETKKQRKDSTEDINMARQGRSPSAKDDREESEKRKAQEEKDHQVDEAKKEAVVATQIIDDARRAIRAIAGQIRADDSQRKYKIEVILFNSGKTQAVIKTSGKLNIVQGYDVKNGDYVKGTESTNLKRLNSESSPEESALSGMGEFMEINSNSFQGFTLVVDNYNNYSQTIDRSENDFAGGQSYAILELTDIDTNQIDASPFKFRSELSDVKEVDLKKLVNEEYSEYLNNDR